MAQRIKKGDTVVVMRGREKGKTGEVIRVLREENRVIVKDVNLFPPFVTLVVLLAYISLSSICSWSSISAIL